MYNVLMFSSSSAVRLRCSHAPLQQYSPPAATLALGGRPRHQDKLRLLHEKRMMLMSECNVRACTLAGLGGWNHQWLQAGTTNRRYFLLRHEQIRAATCHSAHGNAS